MSLDPLLSQGLAACARAIAAGEVTSSELVEACLGRIAARSEVRAWAHLDPEAALEQARARDSERPLGPLHGVPVGVKDIIDTRDLPTERGSALFAGRTPDRDAACVARLRDAGAIVLGKTVTTEFAFFAPGPTTNPHNPRHTPGGSSSGSAAAVADFQVPCALGTQTAGSVIRPASFCGVLGFKASYGRFPLEGVMPLAPSLDTLGFFCRELEDIPLLSSVFSTWRAAPPKGNPPRVAWLPTPYWEKAEAPMRESLEAFGARLREAEVPLLTFDAPAFEGLAELQNTLLATEALDVLGPIVAEDPSKVRPQTLALLEAGRKVAPDFGRELDAALKGAAALLDDVFSRCDVILTAAAPGEAPEGLEATGDPLFNRIWTLMGLPCLSLPIGLGPKGLPLAAQLVGRRGGDEELVEAARRLSAWAPLDSRSGPVAG